MKYLAPVILICTIAACDYTYIGPQLNEAPEAWYTVEPAGIELPDHHIVHFHAIAPDTLYWLIYWVDHEFVLRTGKTKPGVIADAPVLYADDFHFMLIYKAWYQGSDTARVTFANDPDMPQSRV